MPRQVLIFPEPPAMGQLLPPAGAPAPAAGSAPSWSDALALHLTLRAWFSSVRPDDPSTGAGGR